MTRLQDENRARNRNVLFAAKILFTGRALLLLVALLAMLLPFTFSTRGLSSGKESIAKSETINPIIFAEPVKQTIFAEKHQEALSVEDHYAQIPYFTESEGMSSTLTLNNNMPDFMLATVSVFNETGESFVVPPIALQPMNAARYSLKELIKDAKGDFTSGSVEVFYYGPSMAVTSQVSIISASKGLSFESSETSAMGFESNKLDAIAWLPESQAQAQVAITNTTGNAVNVTVTASQGQGKSSKSVTLNGREMRLVDLKELIQSQSDTSITALLSVEHNGRPGAVIATGFVLNEQKRFSSNILFVDRATAKSSHLAGAHVRFGEANSKEGFPQGTKFTAPLALANVGDVQTEAHIYVDYTIASVAWRIKIGKLTFAPNEVKQLELAKEMAKRGVTAPVEDAGVDIEYSGKAGSVIGRLTSVDQSGDFVFDVPVKDPLAEMMRGNGSYPWRLDNGYTSVVHLKNTINKKVYALIQVRYEGGSYNLERLPMAPYQTIAVDIRQLRDAQQKDIRDSVMPIGVESGQVVWYEEEVGSLIGRAEIANIQAGIASSFSCGDPCTCPPSFYSAYVTPSLAVGAAGGSTTMAVYETRRNCTTTIFGPYNRTSDSNWTTTNSSVATVTSGSVSYVAVGNCAINAQFAALIYLPGCSTTTVYPNPGSGLSVLQVTVKEVGFKNDHQLSRYISGTTGTVVDSPDGTEPTWKSVSNPNHPVAYTKGATPTLFATFGTSPSAPSGATAKIRVKNGSTVIAQTATLSFSGAQFTVSPINLNQALESTVKTTTPLFTWEISYNGGTTWTSIGLSGPHTMYWTYATPISPPFHNFSGPNPTTHYPPLYDLALEKACGYANGTTTIGTTLGLINLGLKNEIFYDPTAGVIGHPLQIYTLGLDCQCANIAGLFRGLIRSLGIDGQVIYYWGGLNSTQKRIYSGAGQTMLTLRISSNVIEDFVGMDPHFSFHALVSANGTLYDPSYGITRSSLTILETANMTTPLQSSPTYPTQPDSPSGWNCGH